MNLINGFGQASPGFGLDLPTGSGRARGSLHSLSAFVSLPISFEIVYLSLQSGIT